MLRRPILSAARKTARRFAKDRRGAAAIVMALLTPVLIAGLAFGAELGYWELQRRKLQTAVDAAAHAAGTQLRSGITDTTTLKGVAKAVGEVAGYEGGDAGMTLTTPPTAGAYAGDPAALHVTMNHSIPRRFSGIYDSSPVEFTVESTVLVSNGRPACVLSMHPTTSDAISVSGSTTVTLNGCDLAANSISQEAVTQDGNSTLETDCISTVGSVDFSKPQNVTLNDCAAAIENAPVTADPYAAVPEPDSTMSCATNGEKQDFTKSNGTGHPKATTDASFGKKYCGSGTETIQRKLFLDSGIYVFSGGNWKVNGTAEISGSDVTLFFTDGATLDINGGADIDISAPTTGTYSGLVIFFDRDDTGSNKINGGSNFSLVGAVYGVNSAIEFSGNTTGSGPGECTQVIGGTVSMTGNSDFDTDCSNSGTREIRTAQSIRVVE